jgi:hypothetical protein
MQALPAFMTHHCKKLALPAPLGCHSRRPVSRGLQLLVCWAERCAVPHAMQPAQKKKSEHSICRKINCKVCWAERCAVPHAMQPAQKKKSEHNTCRKTSCKVCWAEHQTALGSKPYSRHCIIQTCWFVRATTATCPHALVYTVVCSLRLRSCGIRLLVSRVAYNRTCTLYTTVHLVISLPRTMYVHRIYIWLSPTLVMKQKFANCYRLYITHITHNAAQTASLSFCAIEACTWRAMPGTFYGKGGNSKCLRPHSYIEQGSMAD